MKNKILFLLGAIATIVILTLNMRISTNDDGSDSNLNLLVKMASAEGETSGGGTIPGGCYTTYIFDCWNVFGFNFGQAKICEFQNVYGYPYACSEIPCAGNRIDRKCVQG
ncbi:MAG: hypothetical protein JXB49_29425 [Bacteroidales bacterium]|jgi:hypothetical protein|nr:hypothetical protein [Bacteroidales bacterium]